MNKAQFPVSASLKGEYQVRRLDGVTREVVEETPWFGNLITDIGLDRIGSGSAFMTFCRIGTGTATPANGDTQLSSQSAASSTVASVSSANAGTPNYETTSTIVHEFALGAVVGNMAEVGVGWATSTASTLFSRALINDAGGAPTTITVLSSEILQVSYRFTIYPQVADATGTVVISGTSYAYTSRCYTAATSLALTNSTTFTGVVSTTIAYAGALQAVTAGIGSGLSASLTSGSSLAYTNGTRYRDFTISAAIAIGNIAGGIKTIFGLYSGLIYTQIEFVPNIPKTSANVLNLTFRFSWDRR